MEYHAAFIQPNWPAPPNVKAVVTTRHAPDEKKQKLLTSPYDGFNLASHVGDQPKNVQANRHLLEKTLGLSGSPCWLDQRHSCRVIDVHDYPQGTLPQADASFSNRPGPACVVQTADCLPVLFCDKQGTSVAAAHAGWKGMADGILEATVDRLKLKPGNLLVWLGPAIGPDAYEIDRPVYEAFIKRDPKAEQAFGPSRPGHWYMNLYTLARQKLIACGIDIIYGGGFCTYTHPELFYSYRRNPVTGRMASLIWLE